MSKIYKLVNKIKHYEWGSLKLLPEFLGIENKENLPFAEMWMGTHFKGSSQTEENGSSKDLSEISGELPFLFKLLAVEKPLSIQVHPNKEQAQEGFAREEKSGLSLDDPKRNYKDKNKKNELICAITPFTLMAAGMEITLKPFQALFIPCGVSHSYKKGFCIELMNNSDNVIRGGLTNKYVDIEDFNKIVKEDKFAPHVITPDESVNIFNYEIPAEDFSLSLIRSNGEEISVCIESPAIFIIIDGKLKVNDKKFNKGESIFLPKESKINMEGEFILFVASTKKIIINSSASSAPPRLRENSYRYNS